MVSMVPKCLLLCCLLVAVVASTQMPAPPPVGRLYITSTPPGASITINGKPRPEQTNVTLVVSPGNYKVLISGGPGNLDCPAQDVSVRTGQTVTVACPRQ